MVKKSCILTTSSGHLNICSLDSSINRPYDWWFFTFEFWYGFSHLKEGMGVRCWKSAGEYVLKIAGKLSFPNFALEFSRKNAWVLSFFQLSFDNSVQTKPLVSALSVLDCLLCYLPGFNKISYHADEEMHPLVRNFSPSHTIFKNLDKYATS